MHDKTASRVSELITIWDGGRFKTRVHSFSLRLSGNEADPASQSDWAKRNMSSSPAKKRPLKSTTADLSQATNVAMAVVVLRLVVCLLALVASVDASWVDPDTPQQGQTTKALTKGDDRKYELVCFVAGSCKCCGRGSGKRFLWLTFFLHSFSGFFWWVWACGADLSWRLWSKVDCD